MSSHYFGRIVMQDVEAGVRKHIHWEAMSAPREAAAYTDYMEEFVCVERPHVPGGYPACQCDPDEKIRRTI